MVYDISYKTLIGAKPLCVRFDKVNEFIRVYDGIKYLVIFGDEKHDFIYSRIRYLIVVKSGIAFVTAHNYVKIKADSYDSLSFKKKFTFHNVIILIRSIFDEDKNKY